MQILKEQVDTLGRLRLQGSVELDHVERCPERLVEGERIGQLVCRCRRREIIHELRLPAHDVGHQQISAREPSSSTCDRIRQDPGPTEVRRLRDDNR